MGKIVCEICGSQSIRKENGVFVCQNCGIEYSLSEIKKCFGGPEENVIKKPKVKKATNSSKKHINNLKEQNVSLMDVFQPVIRTDNTTFLPSHLSRYNGKTVMNGAKGKNYLIDGKAYHSIQGFTEISHVVQMYLFHEEKRNLIYVFIPICDFNNTIGRVLSSCYSNDFFNLNYPGSYTEDIFIDNLKNRYSLVNDNYLLLHTAFEYLDKEDLQKKVKTIYYYSNSIITVLANHSLKYPFLLSDSTDVKKALKDMVKLKLVN